MTITLEVAAFVAGVLFILIALFGNVTAGRLEIRSPPRAARITAGVIGGALILGSLTPAILDRYTKQHPDRTPIATRSYVNFSTPSEGDIVDYRQEVRGLARDIPVNHDLWLVLQPETSTRYYPRTNTILGPDGEFNANVQFSNSGEKYTLMAVVTPPASSEEFKRYLNEVERPGIMGGFAELPVGTEVATQIVVTRR